VGRWRSQFRDWIIENSDERMHSVGNQVLHRCWRKGRVNLELLEDSRSFNDRFRDQIVRIWSWECPKRVLDSFLVFKWMGFRSVVVLEGDSWTVEGFRVKLLMSFPNFLFFFSVI
jgi:hypothetical protein